MDRRTFVKAAVGAAAAAGAQALPAIGQAADLDLKTLPDLWDVDRSVANLENAYWGAMPREIYDEYLEQTAFLNRRNVVFVRDGIAGHERTAAMEQVRAGVAALMGAPAGEFALARNGTEALQNLIMQYRPAGAR